MEEGCRVKERRTSGVCCEAVNGFRCLICMFTGPAHDHHHDVNVADDHLFWLFTSDPRMCAYMSVDEQITNLRKLYISCHDDGKKGWLGGDSPQYEIYFRKWFMCEMHVTYFWSKESVFEGRSGNQVLCCCGFFLLSLVRIVQWSGRIVVEG